MLVFIKSIVYSLVYLIKGTMNEHWSGESQKLGASKIHTCFLN